VRIPKKMPSAADAVNKEPNDQFADRTILRDRRSMAFLWASVNVPVAGWFTKCNR